MLRLIRNKERKRRKKKLIIEVPKGTQVTDAKRLVDLVKAYKGTSYYTHSMNKQSDEQLKLLKNLISLILEAKGHIKKV